MICFVEGPRAQQALLDRCRGSAFGCKLAGMVKAYGFEQRLVQFWLSQTAAYGLLEGQMVLCGRPEDPAEARAFLAALGPGSVLCQKEAAAGLGLVVKNQGKVLKKRLPAKTWAKMGAERNSQNMESLKKIHTLLRQWNMAGDFEPFYLDLSHRLRHGVAMVETYQKGEALLGCAVAATVTKEAAMLSAVAVQAGWQGKGIGSQLVGRIEAALPGKSLYVLREEGKNQRFYQRLGYDERESWLEGGG